MADPVPPTSPSSSSTPPRPDGVDATVGKPRRAWWKAAGGLGGRTLVWLLLVALAVAAADRSRAVLDLSADHRFSVSPPPENKVTNFPTFLIAAGVESKGLIGVNYATNSALTARYPNEYEFFGRYAPFQQEEGAPFDLGAQIDYNLAVKGIDGELSIARRDG